MIVGGSVAHCHRVMHGVLGVDPLVLVGVSLGLVGDPGRLLVVRMSGLLGEIFHREGLLHCF